MGESTSRLCVRHFAHGVLACDAFHIKYFRNMSQADAKCVEQMHHDAHGIHGIAFSIDCTHFLGKVPNGQYKGKESGPTVVMEAGCDYNLWFWHCVFGYVGTMIDINIWDSSKQHQSLHDGSFEKNVFDFEIGVRIYYIYILWSKQQMDNTQWADNAQPYATANLHLLVSAVPCCQPIHCCLPDSNH
jgi:hypothetical protein